MRRFVFPILVLFTAACSDDATGPDESLIVGTYTLQTAAGETLPATVSLWNGQRRLEITAGSLTLNQDLTFTRSITWRTTWVDSMASSTEIDEGTYDRNNDKLFLNYRFRSQRPAWVSGRQLKLLVGGVLGLTFERPPPGN